MDQIKKEIKHALINDLKKNTNEKTGVEKHAARTSLAATEKLSKLSQKNVLTGLDLKEARRALAALVLEKRLEKLPQSSIKAMKKSTAHAEAVKNIAESKEFKAALPDSKLTSLNLKQYMKNPAAISRLSDDFDKKIALSNKNIKDIKKQHEKNKELENLKNKNNQRKIG